MFTIGDSVRIQGWRSVGQVVEIVTNNWDWEHPGPAYGVRMPEGMVWVPFALQHLMWVPSR